MKKPLFFLAILLLSLQSRTQNSLDGVTFLKVTSGEESTTYQFNSVEDFEENSEKILDEITSTEPINPKGKSELYTIAFTITVSSNQESITVSGAVTSPLSKVVEEVKKLRSKLIAIAKDKT